MSASPQLATPKIQPTSPKVMRAYGNFWNVMSLTIFSITALSVLYNNWGALTWQHWIAIALIVGQAALYIVAIILPGWPKPRLWLGVYFVGGITLWALTSLFDNNMWWLGMIYFGQTFGLLPPPVVVPGSFFINVLLILYISGWNLANISSNLLMGFGFQWLGSIAVYLWISSIIRTSEERGGLVAKLEAAQLELQAAREKDVELAALRERERLARELHDSLGHALTTIAVQLEAIQRLYRVDPERGAEHVEELKTLTRTSMADLRRSLESLRTPGLGERPLSEALQTLSVEVGRRAALEITCRVPPEADALSPAVQEVLWRAAQESLVNVEKHAHARRVTLTVTIQANIVRLQVSDDGLGIPPGAELQRGHYGLRGMRERVEGLGGSLTLSTPAGGGTRVEVQLPVIVAQVEIKGLS